MEVLQQEIQQITIETLAKSFFKESFIYGFDLFDYLRFTNLLLDFALSNKKKAEVKEESKNLSKDLETHYLPLKSERLIIRTLEESKDLSIFKNWLSDEYGRYFLLSIGTAHKMTLDELIDKDSNIIGIICSGDYAPIGSIAFLDYDPVQHKAELRKLIGKPEMRGMGFAKEAAKLWIQYGITTLGLKKIYLNTLDTNIRNIKLNEELGFKVEGILRHEIFFDGKYHDVLRMALYKE